MKKTITWTNLHRLRALSQGWLLSRRDDSTLEIQRSDEGDVFNTDDEARAFVRGRASCGDETAAVALSLDGQWSPVEYEDFDEGEACLVVAVTFGVVLNIHCDNWFDLSDGERRRILAENVANEQLQLGVDKYEVIDVTKG